MASEDFVQQMRSAGEGWVTAMGIDLTDASEDEVRCEWTVDERHLQAYGIVHGGVHCGVIETICSWGAAIYAFRNGQSVVGLENHTSFLRAVRAGAHLRAVARPIQRGRRTQVWEAQVRDQEDRLVASGQVRLICLDQDARLAGHAVSPQSPP